MAKRQNETPTDFEREDDTGVFYRTIEQARTAQRIAHRLLRATVNQTGTKRVVIATRDYERAEALRKMLVENEVTDSVAIATSSTAVHDYDRMGPVALVVAEPAMAEFCTDLFGEARVFVLDGKDEETVAEMAKVK